MYSSYILSEQSKHKILGIVNPLYNNIVCHHITYNYPDNNEPPMVDNIIVVAEVWDEHMQGLLVRINDSIFRPDGKKYHITLSHDDTVKPVYCNTVMQEMKNIRFLDNEIYLKCYPSLSR